MANKKDNTMFTPVIAVAPGQTIRENMKHLGMNQKELALRLGITTKHLSNVINGKDPITYETALRLETVLGPRAQFWMNLETNYQLTKARLKKEVDLERDLEVLKDLPYKIMSDFGWVPVTSKRNERVYNLRRFFGVTNLELVPRTANAMFRKHKQVGEISNLGVMAWLRKAEIDGMEVRVKRFNRSKLKSYIPLFRELTLKSPEEFYPRLQQLCANCGVALVLVKQLPKTYICGATLWRRNNPIVALSVRGKRADIFWFSFFHEIAHLINHSKKISSVSYEQGDPEDDANKKASDYLIPASLYNKFINEYDYRDKRAITDYAQKAGVAPYILVGRLLHDELIDYASYSDLRPSFEIVY